MTGHFLEQDAQGPALTVHGQAAGDAEGVEGQPFLVEQAAFKPARLTLAR